jgi:hypothetical protein
MTKSMLLAFLHRTIVIKNIEEGSKEMVEK